MTAFLFWNINGKDLRPLVTELAWRHDVDVLMLAESGIEAKALLDTLTRADGGGYEYFPGIGCKRIEVFARFPREFVRTVEETDRVTIRHLTPAGLTDIILAIVHLPSKLYWDDASQAAECCELSRVLRDVEGRLNHSRTVLVGDLNMNPFEDGVVGANGLHGVMSRQIAGGGSREVQHRQYPFFYNPMWSLFGDETPGPPGTYYFANGTHKVFFWNMFDQVLVRPDLLDRFDAREVRIIESANGSRLVGPTGRPDARRASDHLPLFFSLRL